MNQKERRNAELIRLFHCFLAGWVVSIAVNSVWLAVTGDLPSTLTSALVSMAVMTVVYVHSAIRFRRKWQGVLDSYDRPAFGEGTDTPGRPPTDG